MYKSYGELKSWLKKRNFKKNLDNLKKKYKNKKILLYGAGILAKVILDNYDLSELNIIAVSDSKFKGNEIFYGLKTISPDKIQEIKPDIILMNTYLDLLIKEYLNKTYPEIKRIPKIPIIKKTIKDKINVVLEILGVY